MRLVKDEDWNARDGFYSKAQEYGFKDTESLGKLKPLYETINKRQLDPAQLASMLSGEAKPPQGQQQQSPEDRPMTRKEMDEYLASRDARSRAEGEWERHNESSKVKIEAKVGDFLKSAGFKPEAKFSRALKAMIAEDIRQARIEAAGSDDWKRSPLATDRMPPITDAMIESVLNTHKYQDILTEFRGEFLAAIGDGAGAGVRPTAGGSRGGGETSPPKAKDARVPHEEREGFDAEALKITREIAARRAG